MITTSPSPASTHPTTGAPASPPGPPPATDLSPAEAAILEALALGEDPSTVAAAHHTSLLALARWLREPHVADALDALRALLALSRAAWRDRAMRETVESLREVMHAADNLPERRRAASHIIRALRESPHQSRVRKHAEEAPPPPPPTANPNPRTPVLRHANESPPPPPPTSNPNPHTRARQHAEDASPPPNHPTDESADLIITALQRSPGPDARAAVRALFAGPEAESGRFEAALDKLAAALPGAEVTPSTVHPEPDGVRATRAYTLTRPGEPPARLTLRLGRRADDCWLEEIALADSS